MWNYPYLNDQMLRDYPSDKLSDGMAKEMESMDYFKVYTERPFSSLSPDQQKSLIGTRWVLRWKEDQVRCRLVAQGYSQELADGEESFASTPQLLSLKILLLFAIANKWTILSGDVS